MQASVSVLANPCYLFTSIPPALAGFYQPCLLSPVCAVVYCNSISILKWTSREILLTLFLFMMFFPVFIFILRCVTLSVLWYVHPNLASSMPFIPPFSVFAFCFCCFILSLTQNILVLFTQTCHFLCNFTLPSQRAYYCTSYCSLIFNSPSSSSSFFSVYWRRCPVGRQSLAGSGKKLIISGRDKQLAKASSTVYPSCQHST